MTRRPEAASRPFPAMRRYSVLAGLKVIELGQAVAAPHCGPAAGRGRGRRHQGGAAASRDDTRQNAAFYPSGDSAYFAQQNWGKRSVVLDLS